MSDSSFRVFDNVSGAFVMPVTCDQNLLIAALALQTGFITAEQFAQASDACSSNQATSILEPLAEQGWLSTEDRWHLDYLVKRRLEQYAGNAHLVWRQFPEAIQQLADVRMVETSAHAETTVVGAPLGNIGSVPVALPSKSGQRYALHKLHAAGGIGEIWLARDTDLQRDVAVKRLQTARGGEASRMRFLREARITGQLDHPGIVPIYELCTDEVTGYPYYSMRFLKGRTLTVLIQEYHDQKQHGAIDSQALLDLLNAFRIICHTVAYAHSKGIVHRDLKSDNIIVGDYGEVVVIDWGLAKEVGTEDALPRGDATQQELSEAHPFATQAGHILGSPAYMAPEQAAGQLELIGPSTDVYGLSAILYEILTGRPPFVGKNTLDVLLQVQTEPPLAPSEIAAGVPTALEVICLKGLSKACADRQASADLLAAEVQRWVSELAERRQEEDERERFFSLSLDLLAIIESNGAIRQVSPAWESLLGHDREQLTGRPFSELIHAEDMRHFASYLAAGGDQQQRESFETRVFHRDGSHRWISWNVTPLTKDRSIYVVGRDITELKQSQALFQGLLQSAPDALVIVGPEGRIVLVNQQAERIFDYAQSELVNQPVEVLIPERFRDEHPAHVASFFAASSFRPMGAGLSLRGRRKDGQEFPVRISLSQIDTHSGPLVAASIRETAKEQ